MPSSIANKGRKNINRIFVALSLVLICPFASLATDSCCSIPEESSPKETVKHLSFTNENIKFYPPDISKQLSEKYKKAISDYNAFVDKSSARENRYNSTEFSSLSPVGKFSDSRRTPQKTFDAGNNWLGTFYEKFLGPKPAEAANVKGFYSYPELKAILNKKHSFQENALVEF